MSRSPTESPAAASVPADSSTPSPPSTPTDPVDAEQPYVTMLYGRLDVRRRETAELLSRVLRDETTGTPQAISERDAATAMYSEQLATLSAVEDGLCFGRLDRDPAAVADPASDVDQEVLYVGRLGLLDEDHDYEPLLVDWRAPAARPYYTATAASPDAVRRRRHLRTRSRRVRAVDDEILDLAEAARVAALGSAASGSGHVRDGLTGEATLLSALASGRTGRMGDIVATIQAEQDRVIRSSANGVVVVEGGPGTGKTAVALHRAAYLLYTHRRQLAKRGVLVVGPNPTFLRYIEQVLPSLGETSVLLQTVGELYPGVAAQGGESDASAALKGGLDMVKVVASAVRERQELPQRPVRLVVEGEPVVLDRDLVAQARTRARRTRRPHNDAKRTFVREVVDALARREADRVGGDPHDRAGTRLLDKADLADIRAGLREDPDLLAALDRLWPTLTRRSCSPTCSPPARASAPSPAAGPTPTASCCAGRLGPPIRSTPRGGPPPTRRCSTRPRSCSARTTPPSGSARSARRRPTRPTPPACWRSSRWRTTGTRSCCGPPTSSTRACSPGATSRAATPPPPSGRPRTAPGPSVTSSSTRRRSSARWRGGCSCAAAPAAR